MDFNEIKTWLEGNWDAIMLFLEKLYKFILSV